jgi:hypothetical protein
VEGVGLNGRIELDRKRSRILLSVFRILLSVFRILLYFL